jgi:S1-C subfamily serine protease
MRTSREIIEPNPNEYNMDLLEVNMGVEKGSSGGPLFNGAGEVIGLLHGSLGEADASHCSYYVDVHHLNEFVAPYI